MAEWRPPIFAPFESIFGEKVQSFFSVRWIFPRCLFPFSASCRADAVNSHLSIFPASIRYPSRDNTPDIDMSKRFTAFVYFVPVCTPFSLPTRNIHTYTHTVDLFPTLKAACPLSRGRGERDLYAVRTIFQGLLETIYTTTSTSQLIWEGEWNNSRYFCSPPSSLINCAPIYRKNLFIFSSHPSNNTLTSFVCIIFFLDYFWDHRRAFFLFKFCKDEYI